MTIVGATLAAMMVCALSEAALMVAIRGTARTMWNMLLNSESESENEIILPILRASVYLPLKGW